jgi:hypothetical protein
LRATLGCVYNNKKDLGEVELTKENLQYWIL